MLNWFRQGSAPNPLVESDARAFIERFGKDAYFEARLRQHDDEQVIDGNRAPGHWRRVKEAIRRIQLRR